MPERRRTQMKIIKISTELEMTIHDFPEGTMREQNKVLCELIGNGCDIVEHVMPKRLYTMLKMSPTCLKPMCMYLAYIRPENTVMELPKAKDLYIFVSCIWMIFCS